jgi:type VI secretion system protein ImpK
LASPDSVTAAPRADALALLFQEMLTAVVRIRANRQPVGQVDAFREQVRAALVSAQDEAHRKGYTRDDAFSAAQAVVAFIDESILSVQDNPVFRDWHRQPLGPDYFKQHVAGEVFFFNVRDLLTGDDSPRAADILEVYQLCLLLGYRGRFGGRDAEVRNITDRIAEKIQRIRNASPLLVPFWAPTQDQAPSEVDVWRQRFKISFLAAFGLAVILFLLYFVLLHSQVSDLVTASAAAGGVSC